MANVSREIMSRSSAKVTTLPQPQLVHLNLQSQYAQVSKAPHFSSTPGLSATLLTLYAPLVNQFQSAILVLCHIKDAASLLYDSESTEDAQRAGSQLPTLQSKNASSQDNRRAEHESD